MAINRSQDSLTSCNPELYDNIYQVNRRTDLKAISTHAAIPKDTIERSASTEAMNRLQRPSENMVFEPNALFRRIGKYVFLSFAMPPYFLLYGLPKWLLVEGFQFLVAATTSLTKQLKEKSQKPLNLITQKINLLLFFVQMLAKRTIKPVADLGIQLRQFFQNIARYFRKANANVFSRVKESLKKFGQGLKKALGLINQLAENINKRWMNSKNWIKDRALFFNEKIETSVNWIKQTPQFFLGWGNARIQYFNNIRVSWAKKLVSKFQTSSKAAQACTDWVGKQIGLIKNLAKKGLTPLALIYQRMIKPFSRTIANTFRSGWNKLTGFLQDRKKRSLEFLEKVQAKVKSLTPQHALEKLLPTSFLAKLPALIRKILMKIKESPLTDLFFRLSLKGLTFVVVNLTTMLRKLIESISNFYLKVAESLNLFRKQLVQLSKGTLNAIHKSIFLAKKGCENGFHGFLVFVFMIGILLIQGFESLAEITSRWISKVTFFNHKPKNLS